MNLMKFEVCVINNDIKYDEISSYGFTFSEPQLVFVMKCTAMDCLKKRDGKKLCWNYISLFFMENERDGGRRRDAFNSQTVFLVLNLKAKTKILFTREIKGEQFNQTQAFVFSGHSTTMIWFLFFNWKKRSHYCERNLYFDYSSFLFANKSNILIVVIFFYSKCCCMF